MTKNVSKLYTLNSIENLNAFFNATSITMDEGNYLYSSSKGAIHRTVLKKEGDVYKPTTSVSLASDTYSNPHHIEIDPQDMNVMYLTKSN